jgi:magnesium-transporting ATPase (P-type)
MVNQNQVDIAMTQTSPPAQTSPITSPLDETFLHGEPLAHHQLIGTPFHTQTTELTAKQLSTHRERGLTSAEAQRRLPIYGPNELKGESNVTWYKILLAQFINPMTAILVIGLVLSFTASDWVEGAVLAFVILTNAAIGFQQEFKAETTMESLRKMASPTARVLRDTTVSSIAATEVVPGDVILFEEGDIIPADARLIECFHLQADEAQLTGESVPVQKKWVP